MVEQLIYPENVDVETTIGPDGTKLVVIEASFTTPELHEKLKELQELFREITEERVVNRYIISGMDISAAPEIRKRLSNFTSFSKILSSPKSRAYFLSQAPVEFFEIFAELVVRDKMCTYKDYINETYTQRLIQKYANEWAIARYIISETAPEQSVVSISLRDDNRIYLKIVIPEKTLKQIYLEYGKKFSKHLKHLLKQEIYGTKVVALNKMQYDGMLSVYMILADMLIMQGKKIKTPGDVDFELSKLVNVFDLNLQLGNTFSDCSSQSFIDAEKRVKKLLGDRHLRRHLLAVIKKSLSLV